MRASRRVGLLLGVLAGVALIALSCQEAAVAASDSETLAGQPLLAALKAGGLVIYFRHAATDFGQNDEQMTGYEDCARQRNLTDRGREARGTGTLTLTNSVVNAKEARSIAPSWARILRGALDKAHGIGKK